MEAREARRDRTVRYGERARKIHLSKVHPNGNIDCVCEQSAWFFAKRKAVGCGCRRMNPSLGPKIAASLCHGGSGYHPSVKQRIAGKRLCLAWRDALRGFEGDDIEL
jgi:hypothetical protein